ncbi:hypothetical protein [Thermomonas carbonis]|uniref:Uncharacterized protein n=2 Tax=Thermomonas carbonis TaxID=1463158 RepID=A0A7G9SN22_9GAMM|nr:hypothetical protein [Thermomonas carbonis]QNN69247.1 hypothetical protein H9L16_11245 [Thermomonas carbonis]
MSKLAAALIAVTVAFAAPAFAQDQIQAITLRIDAGTALTSTGGDFTSATTGQPLAVGEKVMINEKSASTAIYDSGCEVKFDKPGVYEVPSDCKPGAWVATEGSRVKTWVIVGGALVAAAIIGNSGSDPEDPPPPPLSTGAR